MMPASPVNAGHIVVLGDGFEGLLVANVLADQHRTVTVLPALEDKRQYGDACYSVLPLQPDDLITKLGFSDLDLVTHHSASFSLGVDLGGRTLPFGPVGHDFQGSAFHHHWALVGSQPAYFDFSPAALAIAQQRFAPPVAQNAIGSLQHEIARHVDIASLSDALQARASAKGVKRLNTVVRHISRDHDGYIRELMCANGECIISPTLVVDASGPRALLRGEDDHWLSAGLPTFRMSTDTGTLQEPMAPVSRLRLDAERLDIEVPLQDRRSVCRFVPDEDGQWLPGGLEQPWRHNCVSIGLAACEAMPWMPTHVTALMRSITRLATLLPDAAAPASTRQTFNTQTRAEYEQLHDIDRLLFSTLMDNANRITHRDSFAAKLTLWRKRGFWQSDDADLMETYHWASLLICLGFVPDAHDPLAERLDTKTRQEVVAALAKQVREVVAAFPPLTTYLKAALAASDQRKVGNQ